MNRILAVLLGALMLIPAGADAQIRVPQQDRDSMQRILEQLQQLREQTRGFGGGGSGLGEVRPGGSSGSARTTGSSDITCRVSADRYSIAPGDSVTLTWSSTGATHVRIPLVGREEASGSRTFKPSHTTTYNFQFAGRTGIKTCQVLIFVRTPGQTQWTVPVQRTGSSTLPSVQRPAPPSVRPLAPTTTQMNRRPRGQEAAVITAIEGQIDAMIGFVADFLSK